MSLAATIWERTRDYVVFVALLSVAVGIFVNRYEPLLRSARTMALGLTAPVNALFAEAGRFTRSLDENRELRQRVVALSTEVARLRQARVENERLRSLTNFADSLQSGHVLAQVVSKDLTEQTNLLTIDAGHQDGIDVGMPVVDERGIVGKVVLVNEKYAIVMPHQNTQFAVPATLPALKQDGIVRWDGSSFDRLTMSFVPKSEPVARGMLVTTSPYSGVFPAGIPIGRVDTAMAGPGRNDFEIWVRPTSPLSSVDIVYVLLIRPDIEQERLEAAARDSLGIAG